MAQNSMLPTPQRAYCNLVEYIDHISRKQLSFHIRLEMIKAQNDKIGTFKVFQVSKGSKWSGMLPRRQRTKTRF
jgi:hypothetical protein